LESIINFFRPKNKNRAALSTLRGLGFSLPRVRKALLDLNNIKLRELSLAGGLAASTLSDTIRGMKRTPAAQRLFAVTLELEVKELFDPHEILGDGSE